MPGGGLLAGQWSRAVYGWGYFSVDYALECSVDCDFACYVGVLPFAWATGIAHPMATNRVTHRVIVYGDIWLRGHGEGSYILAPIGPPQTKSERPGPHP